MRPQRESRRLRATHLPERARYIGTSVREADLSLRLDGAGHGLLDTTHFDTVRFPPPDWALETFTRAAGDGELAYTAYRGDDAVRRACAGPVSELLGVEVDPGRNLVLTAGTQNGLFTTLSALVDDGDTVALADPEYLFVERMLRFLGANVVRVGMIDGPDGPQLDLDALEEVARDGVKLLLTSNPNNPTGSVYTEATVRGLAGLAVRHDFLVVVDELYCRLVYPGVPFFHLAAQPGMAERTVTMLGGSKTESLSGFRIGVVVAPAEIVDAIEQVMAMTCLRAPAYAQHLLTRWLVDDQEFVRRRVEELRAIRDLTVDRLRQVDGLVVRPGNGTAYLWPDVSALGLSDVAVAGLLQREAGVVVSPGYQFGPSGVGRFRVCYARDEAQWESALDRMVKALNDSLTDMADSNRTLPD
ncbi:pyridoxal phosphate-dependent aminotransferase [Streptosporangium saharense]|uniref:Aspartate/methionine/tyrosine aminotransferase n=1 Tax=Streptosporangium saharense TaxID=1706840 RepID=A0A7W7QSY5_9ACTN|nr:aminotransferase class I/II-fold pyridoxal phosphate-dependent enzyme [Streptosporangium saharense]MBB4919195.1 aspartate/methionine/tyrosine aminotransferase [Streptosporangium saharense]